MNKMQRALAAGFCSVVFVGAALGGVACDRQEGPLEEMGESLDDAGDEVKDSVDDATR